MANRLGIKQSNYPRSFAVHYWGKVVDTFNYGKFTAFSLCFKTRRALKRVRADPSLGFAEGYMAGEIEVKFANGYDLRDVVRAFYASKFTVAALVRMLPGLLKRFLKYVFWFNTKKLAGKNAQAHYDLPPQLYNNMLDSNLNYSCAMPEEVTDSLEDAQIDKNRVICEKLRLKPGNAIIDIGCGWGGLMGFIARSQPRVKIHGITLSIEQYDSISQDIRYCAKSTDSECSVYLADYRELLKMFRPGSFNKIASVGMFEHIGHNRWQKFCDICYKLLPEGGSMLLHTITKEKWGLPDSFTDEYIFPGGQIPYNKSVLRCLRRAGFTINHVEYFGSSYAWTLNKWREKFYDKWEERIKPYIKCMAPDKFEKMWDCYLSEAQISFETGNLNVMQVLVSRGVPVERREFKLS
ncbi:MAG: class I SAM-dependent methyltransferase [Candidatus Kerfeldbacteria bacterium]|nr:class I SAM-dependent methyltransferase [Candidatus Kerfeldbacteria bacterium]